MTKWIFAFIEGGVLNYIKDEEGKEVERYCTFDIDSLESGECPVCMGEMTKDGDCPDCGYTEDDDDIDMIKKFLAWHKLNQTKEN